MGVLKVAPLYGSVTARRADPAKAFAGVASVLDAKTPIGTAGAKPLVMTSLHVSASLASPTSSGNVLFFLGNANCTETSSLVDFVLLGAGVTNTVLPFDPGLVVPPNASLCAEKSSFAVSAHVSATGYIE